MDENQDNLLTSDSPLDSMNASYSMYNCSYSHLIGSMFDEYNLHNISDRPEHPSPIIVVRDSSVV